MPYKMKYILFVLIFLRICTTTLQDKICTCPNPGCPRITEPNLNALSPEELSIMKSKFIKDAWNERHPTLTKKGIALKDAILKMARVDNEKWNQAAIISTVWIWSLIPQINSRPSICPFAKVVNATVNNKKNRYYCRCLNKGIDQLSIAALDAGRFVVSTSNKKTACLNEPTKPTLPCCYAQGRVYKSYELWNSVGDEYPHEYRNAALTLYESKSYLDQLLGAIATASITETLTEYYNNFDEEILIALLQSQFIGKMNETCCADFNNDLNKLIVKLPEIIFEAAEVTKGTIGCAVETCSPY